MMKKYKLGIFAAVILLAIVLVAAFSLNRENAAYLPIGNVTLSVRVDALVENMHLTDSDMHELIPEDGIIFPERLVRLYESDSVFDVLQRELRAAGIHMSFSTLPGFDLVLVEAINNISPLAAAPMSGWQYRVNAENPLVGASQYILSDGDVIEWRFTLDFDDDW